MKNTRLHGVRFVTNGQVGALAGVNQTGSLSNSIFFLMASLMLSLLLMSAAHADVYNPQAPAPAYVELDATQLDQLVAPIALDPDSLVAQILTASTYPDQVGAADSWLNQNMNLAPDQRAAGANNMSWDPAVKGLIEFPAVLDNLAKNSAWTAQLGNAYYNQPGDVMNAIQAMRQQAQQSKALVTTAQERVVVEAGVIDIVPVDATVVYVPYYNPWRIWGSLFVAYPGYVVLPPPVGVIYAGGFAFDPGISVGIYAGFGWGFAAWAPAWDGGTVLFGGNTYISNSTTVINHGYFGYHDRGAFEHDGRGVPRGYHACAHAGAARSRAATARADAGHGNFAKPSPAHGGNGSAYGNHAPGSNHGATPSRGTSATNRGGFGNRGTSAANRGESSNRGLSSSNRAAAARSASSASRSASANRGMASANRGAASSRSTAASNRSASANRGMSSANHTASANRGMSAANHSAASRGTAAGGGNHGTAMASRGASPAGHSGGGGGHASSGGHGKGR